MRQNFIICYFLIGQRKVNSHLRTIGGGKTGDFYGTDETFSYGMFRRTLTYSAISLENWTPRA